MKKDEDIKALPETNVPGFDVLEDFIREKVQSLVQGLLEEEVTEFLGRKRYERLEAGEGTSDGPPPYRNGRGKPRTLTLSSGTIEVQRPRIRNLDEQFESRVLPLFKRRSQLVNEMLPELYLHGLALRDFDMALRGLLGEDAPISASSIARLKADWVKEYEEWRNEPITEEPVYMWADGIYVKAGLEKSKAAILVVIGAFADGSKRVLAADVGFRESTDSWKAVFNLLVKRGMKRGPRILVADGGPGLWAAVSEIGWECKEQRCWKHKLGNVLDTLPTNEQNTAKKLLRLIPQSKSREEAEVRRDTFIETYQERYPKSAERLLADWDRLVAFYDFPAEHWKHLRTSNVVESPFQIVRLRTSAARRFKKAENAVAVVWRLLMVAESTFRSLDKIYALQDVEDGVQFINGIPVKKRSDTEAA